MRHTLSVRLSEELSQWLRATARRTRLPKGSIVREHLEAARKAGDKPFLALAGVKSGPKDLSRRRGFSR